MSVYDRLADKSSFTGRSKATEELKKPKDAPANVRGVHTMTNKPKRQAPNSMLKNIGILKGHTSAIFKVAASDTNLFTASLDNTVKQWDVETQRVVQTYQENKAVRTLKLFGTMMVTTGEDQGIKLWDIRGGLMMETKFATNSMATCVSPDGNFLFTGHEDGVINKWDLGNLETPVCSVRKPHKQSGGITALILYENGIASGSRDRTVKTFDFDLDFTKEYIFHHDSLCTLTTLNGTLLSGGRDKAIKHFVQDDNGKEVGKNILRAHEDWVNMLCTWPGEKYFMSGSKDSTIKVWDSETWELKTHMLKHDHAVHDMTWFKNEIFCTASHDSTSLLYRINEEGLS